MLQAAWFVGVDWGSQEHQVCVTDAGGKVLGERMFEHGGAGLSEMADRLLSFAAGAAGDVGVAIETPRGPVVESLMEHGIAVHSLNPKQLDRFRDRLSPAGAKDDRREARVLASALRTDPHCFRRLEPTDPTIVERAQRVDTPAVPQLRGADLPTSLPCIPGAGPNRGAQPRRHQRPPDAGARLPFVAANRKLSPVSSRHARSPWAARQPPVPTAASRRRRCAARSDDRRPATG